MVKLIGALLILISGSSIGWIIASIYLNRVNELKELQVAYNILNTEISYGRTLLPDVLRKTAEVLKPPLSYIFLVTAEELSQAKGISFREIWRKNINEYSQGIYLNQEDLEILRNWGRQIGASTVEDQRKINEMTIKRLELHEDIAREIASRRVKTVRYTGVLLSLMLIILFY